MYNIIPGAAHFFLLPSSLSLSVYMTVSLSEESLGDDNINFCSNALFCMAALILEDVADDRGVVCSSSNGSSPLGLTADNRDLDPEAGVDVKGRT